MNERIKDLIKAAGGIGHDDDGQELTPMLIGSGIEKFVELIVQECEHVVAVQLESERESNDEWDRGYVSGMWAATRYMKQHFGVEE